MQFAAKAFCSDRDLVLTAVQEDGATLGLASQELQNDRGVKSPSDLYPGPRCVREFP